MSTLPDSRTGDLAALRRLPPPEPSLGAEAYRAEIQAALAASPRRAENYAKYTTSNRRSETVDYRPVKLDIENVSRCNFRCTMCVVSDWTKGRRARDMTLEEFKRIIDTEYGVVEIKLQGIGEPLMQGDDFFEMIRYARERRIWVRTTTNASLLHLNENWRKIVDSGVCELQVSIDGADKATFEGIRRGSVFERVVDNCKKLNAYAAERGRRITKMWTVAQDANAHQLRELVEIAAAMGFRDHVFSLQMIDWGLDSWTEHARRSTIEDRFTVEQAESLMAVGEALGVKVRFWSITDKYRTDSAEALCPWPFERAYISSDGRTVPCCMIGNPDVYELSGAAEPFETTWTGEAYAKFRRAHLTGSIPDVCRACYKRDEHWPNHSARDTAT